MCTVSIIPLAPAGAFRLVTSRDESPSRPRGLPPRVRTEDAHLWIAPTDPLGGGTWVSAGEQGLALAILNLNDPSLPAPPRRDPLRSRGLIIPALADAADAGHAAERLGAMDLDRFAPFRLVAADPLSIVELRWDRRGLASSARRCGAAVFASSGLGDSLVLPREALFLEMLADRGASSEAQDEFHQHRWDDRPEISVRMERDVARTVSITSLTVHAPGHTVGVTMRYDDFESVVEERLDRRSAPAVRPGSGRRAGASGVGHAAC